MIVKKAVFIGSFGALGQIPKPSLPEIAFAGRSNVGKSSLINRLLGVRNLALTSSIPGKTRTINFFRVNNDCFFVDLPGYGFSRVPKTEKAGWQKLIEGYLLGRSTLRLLVLIMDIRHGPQPGDIQMLEWMQANELPYLEVLTKADKLSRNRLAAMRRKAGSGGQPQGEACFFSARSGIGTKDIWKAIDMVVA